MAAFAEAGAGGRGGDTKGGDTKGGNGGKAGAGGKGGASKGGDTKGGSSEAKGNAGAGAKGGSSSSGAVGPAGNSETKVGGVTYIFEGDTFGAGVTIGGAQNVQGGSGGSGGSSGASVAGAGGSGGNGPKSGNGGSSGNGGKAGPGGSGAQGGGANGGQAGPGGASGPGGKGGEGGKFDLSLPPIPVRRRARDLFVREVAGDSVYAREESNGQLFIRASKTAVAAPKDGAAVAAKGGAAPAAGGSQKVNAAGEITIDAIVQMIKKKQQWPPALKTAFAGSALAKEWEPPSNLSPCDPDLCNHPSTHAVQVLKSGNIPAEIMGAIKDAANGWKKKGAAGAAGTKGDSVKGTSAAGAAGVAGAAGANGASVKGSSTAGAPAPVKNGAPAAKGTKPKRNAHIDASFYDSELFARYAYPEVFYDNELFTRDVDDSYNNLFSRDADPEYYEDLDLYARDAEADFDDDFGLYARDAEPEFDDDSVVYRRDPEAWYDDRGVFAREAAPAPEHEEAVAHMTDEDMQKLFHTLQTNKKAQAAVMKVVNEDPYLAHYAHELEDNYD
ncbi:hypothetical protein MMC27_005648 [Xylographa pallens]|nr:hypothetical protein [Xylographa pallens]